MLKRASHPAEIPEGDRTSGIPRPWHAGAASKEWAQVILAFIALSAIFMAFYYSIR